MRFAGGPMMAHHEFWLGRGEVYTSILKGGFLWVGVGVPLWIRTYKDDFEEIRVNICCCHEPHH